MSLPRLRRTGMCADGRNCRKVTEAANGTAVSKTSETSYYCPGISINNTRIIIKCGIPICLDCYPDHLKDHLGKTEETIANRIGRGAKRPRVVRSRLPAYQ